MKATLGVDRCVCTLANLCADTWAVCTSWANMWCALGGDALLSSSKGAECHTDESWRLGQYPEGLFSSELAQVHLLVSDLR